MVRFIAAASIILASSFSMPMFLSDAAAETVDGALCGLTSKKISQGWTCDEQREVIGHESWHDNAGINECRDREIYNATWTTVGANGKSNPKKSTTSDEPIAGEWGDWYAATEDYYDVFEGKWYYFCTYEIVLETSNN